MAINAESGFLPSLRWVQRTQEKLSSQSKGIPDEQTCFSEDTRQGVSVEYISCAPIKVHYGDDGEETEEGG